MTTIQDFIDSVRQSLLVCEQNIDTTQKPSPCHNEITWSQLDTVAHVLANRALGAKRWTDEREVSR